MAPSPTLRTFRAADTRAALAAVKAALGPDAVIVSTRSIPRTLLRGPEIEVTAALEAPPAPPPAATGTAREPEPRAALLAPSFAGEMAAMREALAEARRELRRVSRESRIQQALRFDAAAAAVHESLLDAGVEEALAEELVRQSLAAGHAGAEELRTAVRELLRRRISATRAPWLRHGAKVLAFVGPTGVGKTTSLAKIAARAVLESRLRVALITVDTYRVGASDQLARYGEILGAPTWIARDREELVHAVARAAGADLVLVDTAGRSTHEAVAQQAESIRSVPGVQMHLVVSAAAGARELAAVAERYRRLEPERIIVSKVDEAAAPGGVLSALVRIDRPVSCVANGQRVPEDLRAVDELDLVDLVMGSAERERVRAGAR
ncbi:flagellar biosynthesis protein FlhF [Vulgatibacter sp.]|uniref:flagellar biosynthesis protein FlhF n=1 Tax=Vulgatibacter sp. TaxID=1971226 RepID=UPI003566DC0C